MGGAAALRAYFVLAAALALASGLAGATAGKAPPSGEVSVDAAREANRRGVALREKGEREAALREFSEAVRLAPQAPFGWFNRGLTRRDLKDCARAIEDFTKSLELDAGNFGAWYQRGNCLQAEGAYERAVSDYGNAMRLPGRINGRFLAYLARGDAHRRLGRLEPAVSDYSATMQLRKDTKALRSRAWTQAYLGRWQDAYDDAARYLHETEAKESDALYVLLLANAALQRTQGRDAAARFVSEWSGRIASTGWPRPILEALRGAITPAALEAAIHDLGARTEARTWRGLARLAANQQDAGVADLKWVLRSGRPGYWEYDLAFFELRRRGLATDAERRTRE